MKKVEIYTDGACSGNPGPGGWGVLMRYKGKEKEMFGGSEETTNNQMELTAVIEALRQLKEPVDATIYTDSTYVLKGFTQWLPGWVAKNWKSSAKKPVANIELWQELLKLSLPHRLTWVWVKGHNGHPENERVDFLARRFIEELHLNAELK